MDNDTPKIGDHITVVDEVGVEHDALVTIYFGGSSPRMALNAVFVSSDPKKDDPYGRQLERLSSLSHQSSTSAPGRYWK